MNLREQFPQKRDVVYVFYVQRKHKGSFRKERKKMKTVRKNLMVGLLCSVILSFPLSITQADILLEDDFNDGVMDTNKWDWINNTGTTASHSENVAGWLAISLGASGNLNNGNVPGNDHAAGYVSKTTLNLSNGKVTVTSRFFHNSTNGDVYLALMTSNSDINTASDSNDIYYSVEQYWAGAGHALRAVFYAPGAGKIILGDYAGWHTVKYELDGNKYTVWIDDMDNPVATGTFTPHTEDLYVGLLADKDLWNGYTADFDWITVEQVPEPATIAFSVVSLVGLLKRWGRN